MRIIVNRVKNKRSRKGFSLSELLISVGLMAFVATAAIGGLVVVSRARETMDRLNKAEMIMIATVSYLRADLNNCKNPCPMNCSTENNAKATPYTIVSRYSNFIMRKSATSDVTALATYISPVTAYYWNSTPAKATLGGDNKKTPLYGIWVRVECKGFSVPSGWSSGDIFSGRSYVIAQNVMDGTGMYSRIKDGKIEYSADDKLFKFTVEIVDINTGDVILSQYVEVCPDTLMPNIPYNP